MIAALPMYDRPELKADHDAWWDGIRKNLGFGPQKLSRPTDLWALWRDPNLVLAQTCGMPFREHLWPDVSYVGTPNFNLPQCPAGYYNSVIMVGKDSGIGALTDLDDRKMAYNDAVSQSGWSAPLNYMAKYNIKPKTGLETGAHLQSLHAVAQGHADFCAVDAQTFAFAQQFGAVPDNIMELARTGPTPGLPYICSPQFDADGLLHAMRNALADLSPKNRTALGIQEIVQIPTKDYRNVNSPPSPDQVFDIAVN